MGMPEYRQAIENFCEKAGITDVESVLHQGAITMRGIPVWLQYLEVADLCRVVVDLNAPDSGIPAEVCRMMLQSNCVNTSPYLPFLAINPIDGHAILILHLSVSALLHETDLSKLLDEQLAPVMESWREVLGAVDDAVHTAHRFENTGFA
ncbi:type III secretion system chaperone family protein [Noviherbaspirillum pedocola]|uniref:Uncharacterized protein n=1 Tax=Noviherbaspirillum pedocola TaxID=2801341 RepID=A0A934WA49_9BURK|nr:hypothetical protein [Noviherbaspirillum pedocola]MBK4738114.1 hypothetical protein [Noviherbaspirillum pedocola]